jgi:hypothetical protein
MKLFMTTLFAAIESNYLGLPSMKDWADQCIEAAKQPTDWLIDLSMASSSENALDVLRVALPRYGAMLDENYGELLLGFWYMRLREGGVSKNEFATECIDVIDAYEVQELDGTEIVNGECSMRLIESLTNWAKKSEESLGRILEQQFSAEETEALGVT